MTTAPHTATPLYNVQALRGIAAILAVLYHVLLQYNTMHGAVQIPDNYLQLGAGSVDIFFVITGYVIALASINITPNIQSAIQFLGVRVARVLLNYWAFLLLAVVMLAVLMPDMFTLVGRSTSIFLYPVKPPYKGLFPATWVLSYTLYFYLAFSMLLLLPHRVRPYVLGVLFVIILAKNLWFAKVHFFLHWFVAGPYVVEFLAGTLLFYARNSLQQKIWLVPSVLLVLLGSWAGYHYRPPEGSTLWVISFGLFTALGLLNLMLMLEKHNWLVMRGWLKRAGDMSYTLFLCHVLFISLLVLSGARDWVAQQSTGTAEGVIILLLLVSVFTSTQFLRRIELPLYTAVRQWYLALWHTEPVSPALDRAKQEMPSLHNLQALRGIAATLVLLFHALPQYSIMSSILHIPDSYLLVGSSGVDVFFVISGYVIALTTINITPEFKHSMTFLGMRYSRIFLNYWCFLFLAVLVLALWSPATLHQMDVGASLFLYPADFNTIPLAVAWSLSYELYFYTVFAVLLLLPRQLRPGLLVLMFLAVLAKNTLFIDSRFFWHWFLSSPFVLEFLAGTLLFYVRDTVHRASWIVPSLVVSVAGCAAAYYFQVSEGMGMLRTVCFGLFALGLLNLFLSLEKTGRFVATGWFKRNGDASYTLYLCHPIFISVLVLTGLRDWVGQQPAGVAELIFALLLWSTFYFSTVFYRYIEKPLYSTVKKRLRA